MNIRPAATYEAVVDWGTTGATIGMRVVDNAGATTVARVTGFTEYPAGSGLYYRVGNVAPSTGGQYTLVYDDDGGTAAIGHVATEELVVTFTAPTGEAVGSSYATVEELRRILKIRTATAEQEAAMERVLVTAAGEIDAEIDLEDEGELAGWQLSLAAEVNLERAVEHWQQMESPFGIIGLGADLGATHTARDSWERHAHKLAPLKEQWGLA